MQSVSRWHISYYYTGGRAIVCPGVQTLQRIDLTTMTLEIKSVFRLRPRQILELNLKRMNLLIF